MQRRKGSSFEAIGALWTRPHHACTRPDLSGVMVITGDEQIGATADDIEGENGAALLLLPMGRWGRCRAHLGFCRRTPWQRGRDEVAEVVVGAGDFPAGRRWRCGTVRLPCCDLREKRSTCTVRVPYTSSRSTAWRNGGQFHGLPALAEGGTFPWRRQQR